MAIVTTDLTNITSTVNNVVIGDGVFDNLMESVTAHLEAQYQLGRINGNDYANVYLGAMQSVIQTASQFTLQKNLTDAQTEQTLQETINKKLTRKAQLFISEQQLISEKITNGEEINQYIWEISYDDGTDNTYTFVTIQNMTDNDVVALCNYDPHVAEQVVDAVTLNEVIQVAPAGESLAETQIAKTKAEVELLNQKQITEWANTQQNTEIAPTASSLVGRQSTLYENQANGFKWDAVNTYQKAIVDFEKMRMNVTGLVDLDPSDEPDIYNKISDPTV